MASPKRNKSNLVLTDQIVNHERLPPICVITGKPTNARATFVQNNIKVNWFLMIFGWAIALLLADRDKFELNLPIDKGVWNELPKARRKSSMGLVLLLAAAGTSVAAISVPVTLIFSGLLALAGVALIIQSERTLRAIYPEVTRTHAHAIIPPSYRFENAHPAFVEAVRKQFSPSR